MAGRDLYACVRLELKGARTASERDPVQEFRVLHRATRFGRADVTKARPWDALYGKRAVGSRFRFLHLKKGQAESEPVVYHEVRFADRRAHVKWHSSRDLDAGRGKILDDFMRDFLAYLADLGIVGARRRRTLTQFSAPGDLHLRLDLTRLGAVGVYDNRLRRDAHPLAAYVSLFARLRPDVHFVPLARLADAPAGGVLALLDATAADFAEEGILAGREDPYPPLYRTTPQIPKQSLVVNGNDPNALGGGDYLDYPFPGPQQLSSLTLRLEAALTEVYLKCAIARGYQQLPLPHVPHDRAYVRKRRHDGETSTTALWFAGGRLQFADLGDPAARRAFTALAAAWGVDYTACFEAVLALAAPPGGKDEPREYAFILGPDLFIAIEDLEERVLYDYGEIARRRRERAALRPMDDFKLGRHYDALKAPELPPLATLTEAADGGHRPAVADAGAGRAASSGALARARAFYARLCAFDRLLDDIAMTHPTISLEELASAAWMGDIARILGGTQGDNKPLRHILLAKYRKLGRFLSDRGDDVQLSQGIWHDATGAFVVGATSPMHLDGQEKAHLLRRFRVLQGEGHFDRQEQLAAMAVQFVRPRQYTVLPYYFHLIDLYVDTVLRYT
jgi:hypothetical protein